MERARGHPLWTARAARKQAYDATHPGKHYGVGFGCIQRRFGTGSEASLAKVELAPDGRIALSHSGTEIGTGTSSAQAVACVRWLGRPADALALAVTEWPDLPVETSDDPHSTPEETRIGQPIKTAWPRTRAGLPFLQRRRVQATRRTTSRIRHGKQRASFISTGYGQRHWQSGAATQARHRPQ